MNLNDILGKLESSEKPITQLIHKTDSSKVIAIGLAKGVALKEHKSPGPAKIVVIKGNIRYEANNSELELSAFDEYEIPLDEIHSVIGLDHSIFLLMIA